ncbi:hypothetical protein [Enterococcus rivorum]|uniref:hypothetical protein n=1 Tax=Enterococcus rivorum TaxID=762845 RepID=UPI003627B584
MISSVGEGVAFLGTAGNFAGGKEGYKKIDFANKAWYKTLKAFNQKQPKMREEIVINTDGERPIYEVYVNGKKDTKKTKELQEMFRVHNVELFKEYGPEIFKILMNLDDVEIILDKDSTKLQRSSSSIFLLLSILPPDKVKDFLKTAKLLAKGEHSMDAIKLSAKEWQILKDFEKSADTVKTMDRGKDATKVAKNIETLDDLKKLKNTDVFTDKSLKHVFEGELTKRGASGYHVDTIDGSIGKL